MPGVRRRACAQGRKRLRRSTPDARRAGPAAQVRACREERRPMTDRVRRAKRAGRPADPGSGRRLPGNLPVRTGRTGAKPDEAGGGADFRPMSRNRPRGSVVNNSGRRRKAHGHCGLRNPPGHAATRSADGRFFALRSGPNARDLIPDRRFWARRAGSGAGRPEDGRAGANWRTRTAPHGGGRRGAPKAGTDQRDADPVSDAVGTVAAQPCLKMPPPGYGGHRAGRPAGGER